MSYAFHFAKVGDSILTSTYFAPNDAYYLRLPSSLKV